METEVNGIRYRTDRRLNMFEQLHLFRKLAPLLSGAGETFQKMPPPNEDGSMPKEFWKAIEPIALALSEMSQGDSEFIIKTCLKTVQRATGQGGWARLTTPTGELMFDDLELMPTLQIVLAVVQDTYGDFFVGPRLNGSGAGVSLSPSPS